MAATTAATDERARKRVESLVTAYNKAMPATNFDLPFTKTIQVVSAKADVPPNATATATFTGTIPIEYVNNHGPGREIHGGAVAMFFDNTTSCALLACSRYWGQGVTRSMNVQYFAAPRAGDRIVIEAEVLHIGKAVATIQGVLRRASDDVVLAMCVHEKLNSAGGRGKPFSSL